MMRDCTVCNTSLSPVLGVLISLAFSLTLIGGQGLESGEFRAILNPLIHSGASSAPVPKQVMRERVGEAAKIAVGRLREQMKELHPVEAAPIGNLTEEITFPFQRCAPLRGRNQARDTLKALEADYAKLKRNPPRNLSGKVDKTSYRNRQLGLRRKINAVKAEMKQFDMIGRDVEAELTMTNVHIARHLDKGNIAAAEALAVCLFVLQKTEQLTLPHITAVSPIWTKLATLDKPTRQRVEKIARAQVVTWVARNLGEKNIVYQDLDKLDSQDGTVSISVVMGPSFGDKIQPLSPIANMDRNLEILFLQPQPVSSKIRPVFEHWFKQERNEYGVPRAVIQESIRKADPALARDAAVVTMFHNLLTEASDPFEKSTL